MNSLEIREFIFSLQKFVENSPLPLEVKSMVFQSMTNDLKKMADAEVQQLLIERQNSSETEIEERTDED